MVEKDAAAAKHVVTLTIIHRYPMTIHLGHSVGTARIEWRGFTLRYFLNIAKHLAAACLIEADLFGVQQSNRFQHARYANSREFTRKDRLLPTGWHKAHRCQIIDFVGINSLYDINDGQLIQKVCLVKREVTLEVGNTFEILRTGTADDTVHLVAFLQQPIGQVTAVLSRNAGD